MGTTAVRRAAVLISVLCFLCLFFGGALLGFEQVALDSHSYDQLHEQLDVYESVGIAPEALARVTAVLAEYLRGERDNIDIKEEMFGVYQPIFNEREKAHMVDVLALFQLERTLRSALLIAALLLAAIVIWLARRELAGIVLRGLRNATVVLAVLGLGGYLLNHSRGFEELFIAFHHIFFQNDLWLLNPATDAMIRMLPQDFFAAIAAQAGASALVWGVVFVVAGEMLLLGIALVRQYIGGKRAS